MNLPITRDILRKFAENSGDHLTRQAEDELAAMEGEVERLRRVLEKYGSHTGNCPKSYDGAEDAVCDCGFTAALLGPTKEE